MPERWRRIAARLWRPRDGWSWRWLDDTSWDIRFALRQCRQNPGFTVAAVSTLALGIGLNATVFTVTNAMLFRGFPHVDPDNRIVYITTAGGESYPDFQDWHAQATSSLSRMAVVGSGGLRVRLRDQRRAPEVYDGTQLSADAFRVLEQSPIRGRDFSSADEAPGAAPVTMLSYGLWERRYLKDPAIIGQTIWIDENPTTVIGVMAAGFDFPHHRVDLWIPLVPTPTLAQRQARVLWFAFGRIAPEATIASVRAEMDEIGRRLEAAHPLTNRGVHPRVMKFHEFFLGPNAAAIYGSMWAAVGFVLLIACANLANLLLARAIGRSREIAIRIALGAGRWRIIRQLLIESVTLSAAGGVAGSLIARWSVRTYELVADPPSGYNRWSYALDDHVFAYLLAISIGTGLLFGLVPAMRLASLDVNATMKQGGRGGRGGRRTDASVLLVMGEMALAVVLLAGAGVMIRTFLNMYTADLGVNASDILTASVRLPPTRYPGVEGQMAFYDRLTTQVTAIPGVESVALASHLPGLYAPRLRVEPADAAPVDEARRLAVASVVIGPTYFSTVGARLHAGRPFSEGDAPSGVPVAIVNQRFASAVWPHEDPLGKRLRLSDGKTPDAWRTVVGVVSNIVQNDPTGQTFDPLVYVPFRQKPAATMVVIARTAVPPDGLVTAFRRAIQALDSDLVIGSGLGSIEGPKTLAESLTYNYWSRGLNGVLFLIFAATALLLAAVGLYAVVAQAVTVRTQEIGVRIAIGATARDVLSLVLATAMRPVGIGLVLGLTASLAVTPLLRSQLVRVSAIDPLTLSVTIVVLIVAAIVGCAVPAWRAMRVDPMVALRHE